jgi:putative thioredoxin
MEQIIGQSGAGNGALIKDSDTARFGDDVIHASMETPVIVDFWAPWCGPCKQLGPVLEKVVTAAAGAVRLVKINVDENQQLAAQLRVQSIPAVFAFKNGQPVDGFMGALPESQVRSFVERLAGAIGPTPTEEAIEEARMRLEAGDFAGAAGLFGQALKAEPANPEAAAGLAQCYVANGDLDRARQILAMVPPEHQNHTAVLGAQAAVTLAEEAQDIGDVAELQARIAANPRDFEARFDLSKALVARGQREEAVDALLEIVMRNKTWNEEAARKQLIKLFDAFGPTDEVTLSGRRRLSSILFS